MPTVEQIFAPIKKLAKEQQEKAKLRGGGELVNCLYHDSWVFTYATKGEDKSVVTEVGFNELEGIAEDEKVYLRSLLVELCGGYQGQGNRLKRPKSSVIPFLKSIYNFAKEQGLPLHIGLWNLDALETWVKWLVESRFERGDGVAYNTLTNLFSAFNTLHKRHVFPVKPFGSGKLKRLVRPIIKSYSSVYGYDSEDHFFGDWLKGNNFATVPLEAAIVLLGYSLEVLQSDEVKILESYFSVSRSCGNKLGKTNSATKFFDEFIGTLIEKGIEFYDSSFESHTSNKKQLLEERRQWFKGFSSDIKDRFNDDEGYSNERFNKAFRSLVEKGQEHQTGNEKTSFNAIHKYAEHVYDCMYVLLLCTTGFRYHEIRNISALDCIDLDSSGHLRLKTTIDKTPAGLIERTVHPVVNNVVSVLNTLSYVQKDIEYQTSGHSYRSGGMRKTLSFKGIPSLFSRCLSVSSFFNGGGPALFGGSQSLMEFGEDTANNMIKRVWSYGTSRISSDLKSKLEARIGNRGLSSHGFRHTWVEFALLNFTDSTEGGVLSGIARNFGYSSEDMTNFLENYLTGKFSQAHVRRVETEVTKTLVLRLFGEVVQKAIENPEDESVWLPEHFKGDMSTKLALYVRDQVEDVAMATEDELYEIAEDLVQENLVRIEANPWGYCILFEDGKKKAACIDSKHDIQKENGGAFGLCMRCPNHLIYLPVNEDYLKQTKVTHNEIISVYKNQNQILVDFNSPEQKALILKASQNAIDEIERHLGAA